MNTNNTIPIITHDAYSILTAQYRRRIWWLMVQRLALLAALVVAVAWATVNTGGCK